MFQNIEEAARESGLYLSEVSGGWTYDEENPHIARFCYELSACRADDDKETLVRVGEVDGYRITQDWSVENELELWDEADALDSDVVNCVEALIRELRACREVFAGAPDVTMAQRITIVRHVEAVVPVQSAALTRRAVACVAMMDAPVLMLVDPWPMSQERKAPAGKLKGRSHAAKLLELGFVRMVGSRFVWAWNRQLSDSWMADYAYGKLLSAKREGRLDRVLKSPIAEEVFGPLPTDLAESLGVPDPDDLMRE